MSHHRDVSERRNRKETRLPTNVRSATGSDNPAAITPTTVATLTGALGAAKPAAFVAVRKCAGRDFGPTLMRVTN